LSSGLGRLPGSGISISGGDGGNGAAGCDCGLGGDDGEVDDGEVMETDCPKQAGETIDARKMSFAPMLDIRASLENVTMAAIS
jgi:hypothetical protein